MVKQGSKMLKVTSILMIIFGALGLLSDLMVFVALSDEGLWDMASRYGYGMGTFNFALICLVLSSIFMLIAGIVGVNSWYKKEKAGTCIALGFIVIILIILGVVLEAIFFGKLGEAYGRRNPFEGINVALALGGAIALVVPILYVVGAYKLKNMQFQPVNYNAYYGYNQGYGAQGYAGQQGYGAQGYTGQQGYGQPNYTNPAYTGQQGYSNPAYTGQQGFGQPNYANPAYTGQQGYGQPNYTDPAYAGQQTGPAQQTAPAQQANSGQLYPWQQGYSNPNYSAGAGQDNNAQAPSGSENQ